MRGCVTQLERESLDEFARRIDPAEQNIGDRPAARLSHHPGFQHRRHIVEPIAHRHGGTVVQDDDGIRLHAGHGFDQGDLLFSQVEICAVIAFRLFEGWQRDVQHCHVRRLRDDYRIIDQLLLEGVIGRIAFGISQFGDLACFCSSTKGTSTWVGLMCELPPPWKWAILGRAPDDSNMLLIAAAAGCRRS